MANENNPGNPEDTGSSDEFFAAMDRDVNGAIIDEDQPEQVTPQDIGPSQVTQDQTGGPQNNVDWEKRYKDSSREATRMAEQLNTLKPFVPLLKAMKQDSGLVNTVKDYLNNGGKPAESIKERLGLKEDFVFDSEEAFENPESDSAKLLQSHVDGIVQSKVGKLMQQQTMQSKQEAINNAREQEIVAFKERTGMSDEQFEGMMETAKNRKMTLDDVHFLVNREKANRNVRNSTRDDMLNQMKNVRNIPATASGINSPRSEQTPDDQLFDDIIGSDKGISELFG